MRLLPLLILVACAAPPEESAGESGDTRDTADTADSGDTDDTSDSGDTADSGDSSDTGPPDPLPGLVLPDLAGMDLVYVHVDTMRADHLPFHGYARDTIPNLSRRSWLVVNGVHGASSWTMPSTASLLTAEPPDVHGLTDDGSKAGSASLSLRVPTVAALLGAHGYTSALISGNRWPTELTDMHDSFDVSITHPKNDWRYNSQMLVDEAIPWLDGLAADQRFFLFLQPMDMHLPLWVDPVDQGTFLDGEPPWDRSIVDQRAYERQVEAALAEDPEGATRALNDLYDEQMLGWDRAVEALLVALEERGRLDRTVVVVSGDHGEVLNDVGDAQIGHGQWLYEELTAVPFLILLPDGTAGELDCVAPNMDVFPTLLEAMGLPAMEGVTGRSLREACPGHAVASLWWNPDELKSITATNGRERVERTCDDQREVGYDLATDPAEVDPLPVAALREGEAQHAAIEEALVRIRAAYPKVTCAAEHGP